MIQDIFILTGLVDFVLYVSYIAFKYGVQKSISISFYDLPKEHRYYFRVYIWILCLTIIIGGSLSPLFIASGLCLSVVGVFTRILVPWKKYIHTFGAVTGIVLVYAGLTFENLEIGLMAIGVTLLSAFVVFILGKINRIIWNIEIICFSVLIASLMIINNA